jgi:hypothetical protein
MTVLQHPKLNAYRPKILPGTGSEADICRMINQIRQPVVSGPVCDYFAASSIF